MNNHFGDHHDHHDHVHDHDHDRNHKPRKHRTRTHNCGHCAHKHDHHCSDPCDHFCSPPFRPIPGESPMEANARLYRHVKAMEKRFSSGVNSIDNIIRELKHSVYFNGAYWDGDVKISEGYSNLDSTAYKLIKIPHCTKSGTHIPFDLHLAYGNPTNSQLNETVFDASAFELADKIFSAAPGSAPWTGHMTSHGAPLPATVDPELYTLGVLKGGKLKWYKNTVSRDQLSRDCVWNSSGATGLLVNAHQVCAPEFWGVEATGPQQTARIVIGQNWTTMDIYVLVVGDYDKVNNTNGSEKGMLPGTAGEIMAELCDFAVNVSLGGGDFGSAALDKGQQLFLPSNAHVQQNTAFWFISKKHCFPDDYTFSLATLVQLYGQLKWQLVLNTRAVEQVERDIEDILERIDELVVRLDTIDDHLEVIDGRLDTIDGEIVSINQAIAGIIDRINAIDSDILDLTNKYNQILVSISQIQAKLAEHTADLQSLHEQDVQFDIKLNQFEAQLAAMDALIAQVLNDVLEVKQAVLDFGQKIVEFEDKLNGYDTQFEQWDITFTDWTNQFVSWQSTINNLIQEINDALALLSNVDVMLRDGYLTYNGSSWDQGDATTVTIPGAVSDFYIPTWTSEQKDALSNYIGTGGTPPGLVNVYRYIDNAQTGDSNFCIYIRGGVQSTETNPGGSGPVNTHSYLYAELETFVGGGTQNVLGIPTIIPPTSGGNDSYTIYPFEGDNTDIQSFNDSIYQDTGHMVIIPRVVRGYDRQQGIGTPIVGEHAAVRIELSWRAVRINGSYYVYMYYRVIKTSGRRVIRGISW